MAFTSVNYTFSNSTTADATQVNQNFTDLVNGLSDGTKDISVNAGTFAGNVSISGNTTLGNASGDDVTITGSLASSIPIKTTNSYDIGSSTLGLRAIYFGANSQTVKIQGSSSMSATWTMTLPVSAGTDDYVLKTNGLGVTSWRAWTTPTVQRFTSGSGTYTTPANVKYIVVEMVGGGGGGGGSGASGNTIGGAGGNSTFGSSLLTANGGGGGDNNANTAIGGAGGSATASSPAITLVALTGGQGQGSSGVYGPGGQGAATPFGGEGGGGYVGHQAGIAAVTNSGSGGGGAGSSGSTIAGGGGGGAGGYIKAIITSPSATYSYAVGAAGTAGTAATRNGGAGGSGVIIVTEYYQ